MLTPGFDAVVRTAPLGVQFRDAMDGRVVAAGLEVDLLDALRPAKPLRLHANPSGVFVAHAVRGLAGFGDFGESEAGGMDSPSAGRFSLAVHDPLGRYVDTAVALELPAWGLFGPACLHGSPGTRSPHVPLFSAPTRSLPGTLAALRADLRLDSDERAPVSWAWLELWFGGTRLAAGMADANGSVLLLGPLPKPRQPTRRASPPQGFERLVWDVSLRACWHPAHRGLPVPDLCDVLEQPEVGLLQSRGSAEPLGTLRLGAGEPLRAASADSPFLLIAA
jgi:hypothetical protein